jgi:hypothetical protein
MPLLPSDLLKPTKFILPTSKDLPEAEQEWAVVEVGPILGEDFVKSANLTSASAYTYEILVNRILEWNVLDTDGTPALISTETVRRLPMEDLTFLMAEAIKGNEVVSDPKESPTNSKVISVQ